MVKSLKPFETESIKSDLSLKNWHLQMQARHESQGGEIGFRLWKFCYKGCKPCLWFDSIDYDRVLCKCCFKFRTLKTLGTFLILVSAIYVIMFSIFKEKVFPGGTVFFLFLLFVTAFVVGHLLTFAGLPAMLGHMIIGIIFGNLPRAWLPGYDTTLFERISYFCEKSYLIIAIIRAGLLLDLSRIKGHVQFILKISVIPLFCEQIVVAVAAHYLLNLPWDWSALQGSLLCIVSLATVTSVMDKNRVSGYGEDKHLSTVLIAAAAVDVVVGLFSYVMCLTYIFPGRWQNRIQSSAGQIFANVFEQVIIGILSGCVCGFWISFFPDKRHMEAALIRILELGLCSYAMAWLCYEFQIIAAGILGIIVMCIVAANMWAELGWADRSNPVQYFYTMVYYCGQPVALSLVGFSMNFQTTEPQYLGLAFGVILIGITGKQISVFLVSLDKTYPTSKKEKVFICIAWFTKGTFQVLLAYAVQYLTEENQDTLNEITYKTYLLQSRIVKETTIMAIFLATPVACYSLALLSPVLLSKKNGRRSVSFRHSDIQQNIPAFVSKPGTTNQIGNPSGGLPPNQPNNDFRNGLGSRIDNDPDIPLTKSQSRFRLKNLFGRQTPRMLNSQS